MATQFQYTISTGTLNGAVAPNKLQQEIRVSDITIALEGLTISADTLTINFKTDLPALDVTELNNVVAAHDGNPGLDDPQKTTIVDANGNPVGESGQPRIQVDVVGTLGDAKVLVSTDDADSAFLEDKIEALDNKVSVTTDNPGGTETLKIAIVPGNIGTSELNNDANFINASGAPVQPSDLTDFETTSELNNRDANNRVRSNHTGTQLASTISDFASAVQAAETTTSLSFNNTTKILTSCSRTN